MSQEVKPYKYFDTPDGCDVFRKLWCVMKPATLTAFGIGTFDVLAWSHPKGYLPTFGRYIYVGTPILGASATFVLVTNGVTSLRKKDDRLNWFIGGFSAGAFVGAWKKNPMVGFNTGMVFGILAVCRKVLQENNWNVIPPDNIPIASQNVWNYDFSLTRDRPGNWTTGKE
ncbi:uncharacterized protein LOC130445692 [Diorhabda sublineata]|uniref:uncharacterized protein LOC130445692 n=1 Tax=Diorhabda sublineata TaxID=1163346 RepID=UPI0024E0D2EF|nr:uncharacterized protein LOC130445692 [Diorhabda sublineata]